MKSRINNLKILLKLNIYFNRICIFLLVYQLFGPLSLSAQGAQISSVNGSYSVAGSIDFNYSIQGSATGTAYVSPTVYNCYFGHSGAAGNNNYTISQTNSFISGGNTFQFVAQSDVFNIRRVDNATSTGIKDVSWFEESLPHSGTTINHKPDYFNSDQAFMNSLYLNIGTDETFVNTATAHFANIERLDYVFSYGLKTHTPDNAGFAIFDRGGNDSFQIAAITAIDGSGNATGYGPLVNVSSTQWGASAINLTYTIFIKASTDAFFRPSNVGGPQDVKGCYVSFSDLGISENQIIYGYCMIPLDVTVANYTDYTSYPTNTGSGANGIDLCPGGAAYCSDGNLLSATPEICGNGTDDNLDGRTDEAIPGGAADNLLLWLKADDGFSATTWTDQGPFGNDATVFGDPTSVSNSLNFNPGINFDGNDHVEVDLPEAVFENGNNHFSIFMVFTPSVASTNIGLFGNETAAAGNNIGVRDNEIMTGWFTNPTVNEPLYFGNNPHLICLQIDEEDNVGGAASSSAVYLDGTLLQNFFFDEQGAIDVDSNFHIGSTGTHANSKFFQGDIHEMIIYHETDGNSSITNDQRIEIETYLATKYGITLSHNYSDSQ